MNQMIERVDWSKVAGVKEWSRRGGEGERERSGVKERFVCRLK